MRTNAQAGDTSLGTWMLNAAKSTFSSGGQLTSGTIKFETAGAGIKFIVDVDGTVNDHFAFTANYDGKDTPINSLLGDMVALTRINANTTNAVFKKDGKVTTTETWVISEDGKTLTITATGTVNNVTVWNKQ